MRPVPRVCTSSGLISSSASRGPSSPQSSPPARLRPPAHRRRPPAPAAAGQHRQIAARASSARARFAIPAPARAACRTAFDQTPPAPTMTTAPNCGSHARADDHFRASRNHRLHDAFERRGGFDGGQLALDLLPCAPHVIIAAQIELDSADVALCASSRELTFETTGYPDARAAITARPRCDDPVGRHRHAREREQLLDFGFGKFGLRRQNAAMLPQRLALPAQVTAYRGLRRTRRPL